MYFILNPSVWPAFIRHLRRSHSSSPPTLMLPVRFDRAGAGCFSFGWARFPWSSCGCQLGHALLATVVVTNHCARLRETAHALSKPGLVPTTMVV